MSSYSQVVCATIGNKRYVLPQTYQSRILAVNGAYACCREIESYNNSNNKLAFQFSNLSTLENLIRNNTSIMFDVSMFESPNSDSIEDKESRFNLITVTIEN